MWTRKLNAEHRDRCWVSLRSLQKHDAAQWAVHHGRIMGADRVSPSNLGENTRPEAGDAFPTTFKGATTSCFAATWQIINNRCESERWFSTRLKETSSEMWSQHKSCTSSSKRSKMYPLWLPVFWLTHQEKDHLLYKAQTFTYLHQDDWLSDFWS